MLKASKELYLAGACLVLVLAAALRLHGLDGESLWMDEIRQVLSYRHLDPSFLIQSFNRLSEEAAAQAQPPLDYWIGALAFRLWPTDSGGRLSSACFGIGAVFFLMLLVAGETTRPTGILAGVVMALLPFHLYYSQEARPYAIVVFFLLVVLWSLDRASRRDRPRLRDYALVLLCAAAFLYSRAFAPLVVTTSLVLILLLRLIINLRKDGLLRTARQKHRLLASCVLLIAVATYLPTFRIILAHGRRFTSDSATIGLDLLVEAARNFSLGPLWGAYMAQLEPFGLAFLPLIFAALCLAALLPAWRGSFLLSTTAALLPVASLLYVSVFLTTVNSALRPPYLIFILPLSLILAAASAWEIRNRLAAGRFARFVRPLTAAVIVLILLAGGRWVHGFKDMPHRTDWRGLAEYLEATCTAQHALVADALSPHHLWEPCFYGLRKRYYRKGPCQRIAIPSRAYVPFVERFTDGPAEPVFLLFQWRDHYLTPYSRYAVHFTPVGHEEVDYTPIASDPALEVTTFTGFTVIRLRQPSGRLARDILTIIRRLLIHLPVDSSVVDLHLAAASLARSLEDPEWELHLARSEELVEAGALPRIRALAAAIGSAPIARSGSSAD